MTFLSLQLSNNVWRYLVDQSECWYYFPLLVIKCQHDEYLLEWKVDNSSNVGLKSYTLTIGCMTLIESLELEMIHGNYLGRRTWLQKSFKMFETPNEVRLASSISMPILLFSFQMFERFK